MDKEPPPENNPTIPPQTRLDEQIVDAMLPLLEKSGHFNQHIIARLQQLLKDKAAPQILLDLLRQ